MISRNSLRPSAVKRIEGIVTSCFLGNANLFQSFDELADVRVTVGHGDSFWRATVPVPDLALASRQAEASHDLSE